jgi:hypothetical protein
VFELLEALERHVSRMVKEKACVTCVNFEDGCKLSLNKEWNATRTRKAYTYQHTQQLKLPLFYVW